MLEKTPVTWKEKLRGWKNTNQKEARAALLISVKIEFQTKKKKKLLRIERARYIDKSFNSLERYNISKVASKYFFN